MHCAYVDEFQYTMNNENKCSNIENSQMNVIAYYEINRFEYFHFQYI